MNLSLTSRALLGAPLLLAGTAGAQTITPVLVEGDTLPNGLVTSILNCDVNNSGDWLAEVDTDNATLTIDNAIVHNGTMIHQEGTDLGFPVSLGGQYVYWSFVDSMDINDNGDRLISFNTQDVNTLTTQTIVLWTNGSTGVTYPLMIQGVTPCTITGEPLGAVWSSIAEVWQNNNNQIVVAGRSDTDADDFMAVLTHDGAGNILSQVDFVMDNVIHSTQYPGSTGTHADTVQTLGVSKTNFVINDAGQKLFFVDDQSFGSTGTPDYTDVDAHYYIDLQEIAWEADIAPTGFVYNHMSSAEMDLNESGSWLASWDDDNPDTTRDGFIMINGAIWVQEGDAAMVGGGFILENVISNNGGCRLSDNGDVTWTAEWNDPDQTKDKGLYRNFDLLVQEGDVLNGFPVSDIKNSQSGDDMACSDSGRFILKELVIDDGTSGGNEGLYLIEVPLGTAYCFGDGTGSACPCGNNGAAGEGCANGTGAGAILSATGSTSLSGDNLVLAASQCPVNQPGLMFQGEVATNGGLGSPFGDGLRCAGTNVVRLQTVFVNASGDASTSVSISTKGGVSLGDTRYYQFWYRDPAGSACGAFFNLTNGLEITWSL
ncbi:MAG: hypothetical protein H6828_07290 [Planctomycetes bacterium]|nr:hypothetical protein [Planctomycetota bacterium]